MEQTRKQSPAKDAGDWCDMRNFATAYAFPGGGHFAGLSGAATVCRGAEPVSFSSSENKVVINQQSDPGDSTWVFALAARGVFLRLVSQVKTMFVLIAQGRARGSVEFNGQPADRQRQEAEYDVHHVSLAATPMP